jgi:hypothetical protein
VARLRARWWKCSESNISWIGEWYLVVSCRNCGVEFPFQRDDETPEATYFTDSKLIVLACPDCAYSLGFRALRLT